MIEYQDMKYSEGGKYMSGYAMCSLLKEIKSDETKTWLKAVSNGSLKRTCLDLHEAYVNYFNHIHNKPKFKSKKKAKPAYPIRYDRFYFNDGRYVTIEKLGKVKYKTDYTLPYGRGVSFQNVRLSYVDGKYILSFAKESENQAFELTNDRMGVDLGIKNLAVVAFDNKCFTFGNINKSRKMRKLKERLRFYQRTVQKKYLHSKLHNGHVIKSNNMVKLERKIRKLFARQRNIRNNYLNQITSILVNKRPFSITLETLDVVEMKKKNKLLSGLIHEQCFSEFNRQLEYKCMWRNISLIHADKYFPSSKTCSCCGAIKKDLKLSDRIFRCDECGTRIDRDYNAAINLSKYTV